MHQTHKPNPSLGPAARSILCVASLSAAAGAQPASGTAAASQAPEPTFRIFKYQHAVGTVFAGDVTVFPKRRTKLAILVRIGDIHEGKPGNTLTPRTEGGYGGCGTVPAPPGAPMSPSRLAFITPSTKAAPSCAPSASAAGRCPPLAISFIKGCGFSLCLNAWASR